MRLGYYRGVLHLYDKKVMIYHICVMACVAIKYRILILLVVCGLRVA